MSVKISVDIGNHSDVDYNVCLVRINARFLANVKHGNAPLFTTDADLWLAYLDAFTDPAERQHHTCHACRRFVETYGALVTIDATGRTAPAVWHEDDITVNLKPAVAAMVRLVRRAKVTGVFLSQDRVWGQPETGVWHHLSVTPPHAMLHANRLLTPFQAMAAKSEDFKTVMRALSDFTSEHLDLALKLLRSDALYRSEKVLGQAEWLDALHTARAAAHGSVKANVVWRAVAQAPVGFCHPRASMIGTLLEDIAAGMDFTEVSRRFAAKMHPLAYQRPQAAPTTGAIAAAEKLMEQLGAAGSLARRFARLEDVLPFALWKPAVPKFEPQAGGIFGHLKAKDAAAIPDMRIPARTMTWEKFRREVLPAADRIEFKAPNVGPYTSLVTAVNPDAPPILQWDTPEFRNPVSWYFWHGGSTASQFGLVSGRFYQVNAVAFKPSQWHGGHEHQGLGAVFIIDGAADSRRPGLVLFPEILKAEFHGIRSVVEAYSASRQLEGHDQQSAAGVMLGKGASTWSAEVRVHVGPHSMDYRLDRWD